MSFWSQHSWYEYQVWSFVLLPTFITGFYVFFSHLAIKFCTVQIVPKLIGQTSGVSSTCHLKQNLCNNVWNDFMLLQVRHQICVTVNKKFFFDLALLPKSKLLYNWQSVSMSWYRVPLWDLRPDIISCQNVAVWNLRSFIYWAPSLTRGQVCNLQCNHSIVRVTQNPKPYFTVSSETPPTRRARFPYLYPPGTG
jgi:hypothetical protein